MAKAKKPASGDESRTAPWWPAGRDYEVGYPAAKAGYATKKAAKKVGRSRKTVRRRRSR